MFHYRLSHLAAGIHIHRPGVRSDARRNSHRVMPRCRERRVFMLKPAEGIEGVKNAVLTAVRDAGPNACPPMVVGVGIGGTFEKCAILAKKALTRDAGSHSSVPYVKEMEEELLEKINGLGIGPGGLGGRVTALAVNINTYPTHIAGLPVAVNICCHVNRHRTRTI